MAVLRNRQSVDAASAYTSYITPVRVAMRYLHWFQTDLRLDDNPTLSSTLSADSLLCVYLLPKPRPWCNLVGLGAQRDRFLRESLQELREQLQSLGQDLMVLEGSP